MNLNKVLIALALGFALTACTSKDEAANYPIAMLAILMVSNCTISHCRTG